MKKGIFSLILVLGLVISSGAFAADGYYVQIPELGATINNPNPADRLNLRTKPSEDAPTLGKYYTGTFVEVLADDNSGWVKVRFCNLEGYMMKKYLAFGEDRGNVGSAIPAVKVNNLAGVGLNLREKQSLNSASLGLFNNGETVLVYGVGETWCHVQAGGKIGFMLREQLVPVLEFNSTGSAGNRIAIVNNYNPADRLNLRKTASAKAESLGKYYNGVAVTMLSEVQNGWIKVRIGNLEGYMESVYLLVDGQLGSVTSATPTVSVSSANGARLNLREKQSDISNSLGLYNNGTKVQVLGLSETWCHVQVDGKVGFMMSKYLTPKLQYAYADGGGTSGSGSSGGSSSGSSGSGSSGGSSSGSSSGGTWNGPTGTHQIGEWTIPILEYVGIVNNPNPSDRLHLRAEPNENAKSLGRYYNGTQVIINGEINGEWTEVGIGNNTPSNPTGYCLLGYMKTAFLSIGSPTPPASAMPIMTVSNPNAAGNLHLREKQSTASSSLGLYPNGTKVTLLGFNDEWAHVMVEGKMGFMQGKFLK